MTHGMAHEEAHESLEALALDALDAAERAAVMAHVSSCAICREEVTQLRSAAGELSYAVAPIPMSAAQRDRIRARLVGRAAADRGQAHELVPSANARILVPHNAHDIAPIPVPSNWMTSRASWLAFAASVIAVASVTALFQVSRERDVLQDAYRLSSVRSATLDSLRDAVQDRDELIANLTGPQVAVMTLASSGVRAPSARMFWDQAVNKWTFVAHNLPAPKEGRTYQLWLVTASAKISAGTFTPGARGDAVVRATYALAKDALSAVAVTDEPQSGSPQPTTVPFIVGTAATR
ncbi:MAG: anti-sigma factor [Gemmatimonadaceae bacterium]